MNTFWLKVAGLVVVVIGLIILVNVFLSSEDDSEPEPKPEQKTFQDVIRQDDERLRAEPQPEQPSAKQPETEQAAEQPEPAQRFKELSMEEQAHAEKLFEMALAQRKISRLPGMNYNLMVDYCCQIIEKYPDSVYAFKARRMLADIPQQYRKRYNITDEEMGL